MPAMKQDRVPVTCPRCGHVQLEPRTAVSTVCGKCHSHIDLEEDRRSVVVRSKPITRPKRAVVAERKIVCFQCGAALKIPASAESSMCKWCSTHIDLRDYRIDRAVSQNYRTKGRFVIEEKGYLFNSETVVGEAVIKGRFIGKLVAEGDLELHSTARIEGSFRPGRLVIPQGHIFRWKHPIVAGGAEIAGELVSDLRVHGTVVLKATARLFGDIRAINLLMESGAVFVGAVEIGREPATQTVAARAGHDP